jgi:chemotaxis protein MotB
MRRRKKPEPASHDRWLVSYADFITLLFAFFVVLFASGQADKKKQTQLATSIQTAFKQMGIHDPHGNAPSNGAWVAPAPLAEPMAGTGQMMSALRERLNAAAQPDVADGLIAIHESAGGLTVSLQEAGFFDSGAAGIRPSALPVLERIAAALPGSALRVEGHTDDVPISTAQFASNWELSSSRASSIARLLLRHANVKPEQMSVAGYAEFHPVASNATAEGRAKNRRVDIVILAGPR